MEKPASLVNLPAWQQSLNLPRGLLLRSDGDWRRGRRGRGGERWMMWEVFFTSGAAKCGVRSGLPYSLIGHCLHLKKKRKKKKKVYWPLVICLVMNRSRMSFSSTEPLWQRSYYWCTMTATNGHYLFTVPPPSLLLWLGLPLAWRCTLVLSLFYCLWPYFRQFKCSSVFLFVCFYVAWLCNLSCTPSRPTIILHHH